MWVLISNQSIIGQTLTGDDRVQFSDWYEEQKDKIVSKEEALAYCMDDVNVLRHACFSFINLFLN